VVGVKPCSSFGFPLNRRAFPESVLMCKTDLTNSFLPKAAKQMYLYFGRTCRARWNARNFQYQSLPVTKLTRPASTEVTLGSFILQTNQNNL